MSRSLPSTEPSSQGTRAGQQRVRRAPLPPVALFPGEEQQHDAGDGQDAACGMERGHEELDEAELGVRPR